MEDNNMAFDANAYKQLTSEYQLFKHGSENISEVQEDPDFRQNISQVLFGNPNNFSGRPNDVVRKATKEGLEAKSRQFVAETSANLEDILNSALGKPKDEELFPLLFGVGAHAKNPKYAEAVKLHKEIETYVSIEKSQDIDSMMEAISKQYKEINRLFDYISRGPSKDMIPMIFSDMINMKRAELVQKYFTKKEKKDNKEVEVVDRTKLDIYIRDSARNVDDKHKTTSYEPLAMYFAKYA